MLPLFEASRCDGAVLNPLDASTTPSDPLHARFVGRRAWHRVPCGHAVRLRGDRPEAYDGETVDLSRGGVLVAVTDRAFRAGEDRDGMSLIEERFPDGVEIAFVETGVTRRASIVRATLQRGAHLALGCAFEGLLTTPEALALGIAAGETGVDEAGAAVLPFVPRPGVALSLVILGASESVVGPFALGTVRAVGERTIEATFGKTADAVAESCRVEPFNTLLVVGRERVWTGRGRLVACRPDEAGSRVRVLSETELGRSVRKRVEPAPDPAV